MNFFKQMITGMLAGRHGDNKHNGYANKSTGHHGQENYGAYPVNNAVPSSQSCASCQYENNPSQAKFCGQCGKSLKVGSCTACGQKLLGGSKFCGGCGQAV